MKDEPMIRTENDYKSLSAILQEAYKEDAADADLSGYLALTDSILDLISNYKRHGESSDAATAEARDTKIKEVALLCVYSIIIVTLLLLLLLLSL